MPIRVTPRGGLNLTRMKLSDRKLMREIGLFARQQVIRRTIAGKDEDGGAFRAYSPRYRARKAQELGGGGVNLQVSGQMLNAIAIVDVDDDSVELGFKD